MISFHFMFTYSFVALFVVCKKINNFDLHFKSNNLQRKSKHKSLLALLLSTSLLAFLALASDLRSLHQLQDQLLLLGCSFSHVLLPGLVDLPLAMLPGFFLHALLLILGFFLQVDAVEFLIFIEHQLALSPLSEAVLLEHLVVPLKESLDLTDLQ